MAETLGIRILEMDPQTAVNFAHEMGSESFELPRHGFVGAFAAIPEANISGLRVTSSNVVAPPSHRIESMAVVALREDDRLGVKIVDGSSAPFDGAHQGLFRVATTLGQLLGKNVLLSAPHVR